MNGTRTAVAMSGGVDSSVAAALLARRGEPLIGFSMKLDTDGHGRCCSPEDFRDARSVADRLGFPHYVLDLEFLRVLGPTPAPYLGVIGSRTRLEATLRELQLEGAAPPRERIFGPAGLDIGSETPAEIALSIVAEIKAAFERRAAISLREKGATAPVGVR